MLITLSGAVKIFLLSIQILSPETRKIAILMDSPGRINIFEAQTEKYERFRLTRGKLTHQNSVLGRLGRY